MNVYTKRLAISDAVAKRRETGDSIGFVPTMGALHEGHAALIRYALSFTDTVIVSIYVNPTQFNNTSDLEKYPRNTAADITFLENFGDRLLIFAPESSEVYGEKVHSEKYDFGGLEKVMEGQFRPGHFEGVGTVLKHLFAIIKPDKAFFGEKDFQQLQIVKKLVNLENLPVEIIGFPISRHTDGLAESSRNSRLTKAQREAAPFIYQVLLQVKKQFRDKNPEEIYGWVSQQFSNQPELNLEYFEIADPKTLKKVSEIKDGKQYQAFIAVFAGEVRLIDNIALN